MRSVGMLDLKAEYALFRDEVRAAVEAVLESQQFIGGPAVGELERALATRYGVAHAVAISNGTDALLCAMMALEIGGDDEVILPSFTFFATAGAGSRLGARPLFVDIDPRTFNLDPAKIESAITPKTRAIVVVHLFGQCADMDAINTIARRHKLQVIEDAAQAIDAKYKGRPASTLGDIACFSFYPTKNLGGFGEGGMIFTGDERLATLCRRLRNHGESQRYDHERVGGNFRLDTMKAAILLVKLPRLDDFTRHRRRNAARYDKLLADSPVTTPLVADGCEHVYHQYSILCDRRDELMAYLRDRGVASGVYYPVPLHLQKCFADLGYRIGSLPVTEDICKRILSLPCHPMLGDDDVDYIAECIEEFFDHS
ncbi:MAG: DegT/DnrJ/EryC1/StrS family aminotransferase [Phycisphaerales bacterium]|nr:DegT/DnrJ/EryC1/StrS family aminotransferase [Phycisphaerales bacterium]